VSPPVAALDRSAGRLHAATANRITITVVAR
jgi:hypothetical protein